MPEIVRAYAENGLHAEHIATFPSDSLYAACAPALEGWARAADMTLTESVNEKGLAYMVHVSLDSGGCIHKLVYDFAELKSYLEDELLMNEMDCVKSRFKCHFEYDRVTTLVHEESYIFEYFYEDTSLTITAVDLF